MPENFSVGGLASGLDTNSIIDGLVKIEQRRVDQATEKKKGYEVKLGKFNELNTKMLDLAEKAKGLDKVSAFNLFKATSSNSDLAEIDGTTDATPGNYDIKTLSLASSQKVASKSFASQVTALGLSGSFTLSMSAAALKADPSVTSVQVDINSTDSLKDIAAKIGRAKGAGASASIVQMGANDFRLMVTGVDEGSKTFTMDKVGAGTVLTAGLDLVTDKKSTQTDFNFRLSAGGAAANSTTFDQVFRGIGQNYQTGDVINWTATDSAGNPQNGSFTINLADSAADDVGDLLTAMETAFDDGAANRVTTSLNSSGEIVVTDTAAGGAGNFSLALDVNGTTLGAGVNRTDFRNTISAGKKAFYLLNDLSMSSQSNYDETSVVGTKIHLKKADPSETVKLTLDRDDQKITTVVRDFVIAYNTVIKFINENSQVEIKDKKDDGSLLDQLKNSTTNKKAGVTRGPFAGDSSLIGLKQQLQNLITGQIPELNSQNLSQYSSLAAAGITTKRNDGTLDVDDEKFKEALSVDFEGVRRLFVTGGYSDNPGFEYGSSTKDTKTGVYAVNTGTGQIDSDRSASGSSLAAGTLSAGGAVLDSITGDSKGLGVKFTGAVSGALTFIRGVAGQVKLWNDQNNDFVNGFSSQTKKSLDARITGEDKQIEKLQTHVDRFRSRLVNQFAKLEINMAKLQSQSGAFQNSGIGLRR